MRKWVNFGVLVRGSVDSAETRKSILSVDVHSTRPADTLSARPPEGKRGVDLVFNFDQRVENLWGRSQRRTALRDEGELTMGPHWFKSIVYD